MEPAWEVAQQTLSDALIRRADGRIIATDLDYWEAKDIATVVNRLREEVAEYEYLTGLQHRVTQHASRLWQQDTGHSYWPGLHTLIGWLLERAKLPKEDE